MDWQLQDPEDPQDVPFNAKTVRVTDFNQTFIATRDDALTPAQAATDYAGYTDNQSTRSVRLGFYVGSHCEQEVTVSLPDGVIEQPPEN